MYVELLLVFSACIVTGQAWFLGMKRREVEAQQVEVEHVNDVMRCFGRVSYMCPQFRIPGISLTSGRLTVEGHLSFSCSQATLQDNRECASGAQIGCEEIRYLLASMTYMWESMCRNEQALVRNEACFMGLDIPQIAPCATRGSSVEACMSAPGCLRSGILNTRPLCTAEAADLMYNLMRNTTIIAWGANCERFSQFV